MTAQFPLNVQAPENPEGHAFSLTVTVDVTEPKQGPAILAYLRSVQVKNDLMNGWVKQKAPGYGMEIKGGPRPIFQTPNDRNTPVVSYVQEFRLTRPV